MAAHGDGKAANDSGIGDVGHVSRWEFDDSKEASSLGGGNDVIFGGGGVGGDEENSEGEVVARGESRGELERGEEVAHPGA